MWSVPVQPVHCHMLRRTHIPALYVKQTDLSKELYIAAEEGDPAIVARLLNATSEELNCCHAGQVCHQSTPDANENVSDWMTYFVLSCSPS